MAPLVARLGQAFGFGAGAGGAVADSAMTATGGTITTSTVSGVDYKVHSFTSSGSFQVTAAGSGSDYTRVDWLVVAGGGGSGYDGLGNMSGQGRGTGGGGGGGLRSSLPEGPGGPSPTAETYATITGTGTYPVTIGAGGLGSTGPTFSGGGGYSSSGLGGADSVLAFPTGLTPASSPNGIVSTGGGYGGPGIVVIRYQI